MAASDGSLYTFEDLALLMSVLRDPEVGCPWDVAQDWNTIPPHTLEETYEVIDAIQRGAFDELRLELGDLLFQVAYYARFAEEEGRFDLAGVVDGLVTKMVARHPHVFPTGSLESRRCDLPAAQLDQADIKAMWENGKSHERTERSSSSRASLMDDVPDVLPALVRAHKLSSRATRLGFDWPEHRETSNKVEEELGEVREAADEDDPAHLEEEVGDLLFATANYARKLGVDPETALRKANRKFERRFRGVEQRYQSGDSLADLERYWQAVKEAE